MNIFDKISNYFKETRTELKHVNWPTRQNTIKFTVLVIGVSVVLAIFLGALDVLLQFLLTNFVI